MTDMHVGPAVAAAGRPLARVSGACQAGSWPGWRPNPHTHLSRARVGVIDFVPPFVSPGRQGLVSAVSGSLFPNRSVSITVTMHLALLETVIADRPTTLSRSYGNEPHVSIPTYSARHPNGRESTRRPKAQSPPRQTGLADGLQSESVLVLAWAASDGTFHSSFKR